MKEESNLFYSQVCSQSFTLMPVWQTLIYSYKALQMGVVLKKAFLALCTYWMVPKRNLTFFTISFFPSVLHSHACIMWSTCKSHYFLTLLPHSVECPLSESMLPFWDYGALLLLISSWRVQKEICFQHVVKWFAPIA